MADVHQCPFCELRFVTLPELNMHIQLDHPDRRVPERTYRLAQPGRSDPLR